MGGSYVGCSSRTPSRRRSGPSPPAAPPRPLPRHIQAEAETERSEQPRGRAAQQGGTTPARRHAQGRGRGLPSVAPRLELTLRRHDGGLDGVNNRCERLRGHGRGRHVTSWSVVDVAIWRVRVLSNLVSSTRSRTTALPALHNASRCRPACCLVIDRKAGLAA